MATCSIKYSTTSWDVHSRLAKPTSTEKGQAAVEFALVLPFVILAVASLFLAARVIADQARVKGIVDAMVNVGLVEDIRDYYHYNQQSPGVQAVIDRYINNPGISNAPSGKLPYFSMTHSSVQTQQKPQGNTGGYKSKSKSKKSRYNKKSKTNKMRRSRSHKRHRSNKRHRS